MRVQCGPIRVYLISLHLVSDTRGTRTENPAAQRVPTGGTRSPVNYTSCGSILASLAVTCSPPLLSDQPAVASEQQNREWTQRCWYQSRLNSEPMPAKGHRSPCNPPQSATDTRRWWWYSAVGGTLVGTLRFRSGREAVRRTVYFGNLRVRKGGACDS